MPDKYTREAEKLLPERKKVQFFGIITKVQTHRNGLVFGFNDCREEALPIVADLLKHIDELKNRGAK